MVVYFWANWSLPNKQLSSNFEKLSSGKNAVFYKVNVDDVADAMSAFGVTEASVACFPILCACPDNHALNRMQIPTFRVYKDRSKSKEIVGNKATLSGLSVRTCVPLP